MRQTAWIKTGSFVPSDRIPPSYPRPQSAPPKSKRKQNELPKSKEVQRLEKLRDDLQRATGAEKDPKGGCFCTALVHSLSSYTPICHSCGLILCEVQQPYYACPHCSASLLNIAARNALVEDLDKQIAETITREEEERSRAMRAAQEVAGAFPTLSAASSGPSAPTSAQAHPVNQTHKVLSLNSKTKKVTVKSYAPSQPVSRSSSRGKDSPSDATEDPKRVPPPPPEVPFADRIPDPQRPWANLRSGGATYVLPRNGKGSTSQKGAVRKKPRGDGGDARHPRRKDKENQNQND
ncbi:hypothetical protein OBBRIDRAFT_526819 [Obba rivulosa]|uniref:TRIP4/RQT4 C2HC5-type zinc finger domain-containing protein n=1 Tax=Obba rivulosa TaxID=1052685 RepID=A0A8E2AVZ8_9APHY|nr:hypothetical protein OBBRIDRAFT_526819 [Obba rivulosa]